jgi:hypothetical protein
MDKNATTTFALIKNFDEKGNLSLTLDLGFDENIKNPVGKASINFSKTVDEEFEIEGSFKHKFTEDTNKNFSLVSFSVSKYFKEMNKLRGKITYNFDENEDFFSGFSFGIEYTHHFDLPILPRTDLATVEGYVYYKDVENKKGVPEVKIYLNNKLAVTSEEGRYYFSGIAPGNYFLRLDNASIGFNRINMTEFPLEINLAKGEKKIIEDIILVDRSEISIKVIPNRISGKESYPENSAETFESPIDLEGIEFILRNDESNFVLYSSKDGTSSMGGLKPGEWNLEIIDSTLPKGYVLNKNDYNINLTPGMKTYVEIQIKEKPVEVILIDSGDL